MHEWRLKGKNSSSENIYLNWLCYLEWYHYLQCKEWLCADFHTVSTEPLYVFWMYLNFEFVHVFKMCVLFFFFFVENSIGARKRVISLSNEENCRDCCCREPSLPEGFAECKIKHNAQQKFMPPPFKSNNSFMATAYLKLKSI